MTTANFHEVIVNGINVLYSYTTPVACCVDGQYFKTDKFWSKTTSKHVNQWTRVATERPQEYFDGLKEATLATAYRLIEETYC
jgi:hypothetical protein